MCKLDLRWLPAAVTITMSLQIPATETTPMDIDDTMDIGAVAGSLTPVRQRDEWEQPPGAPRRRARSHSEEAETEAYDAVVRLPPVPVMEPLGLQRQQAVDTEGVPICPPLVIDSPDLVYMMQPPRQVAAELELELELEMAASPLKRRDTDIETETEMSVTSTDTDESKIPDLPATDNEEEIASGEEADTEEEVDRVEHVEETCGLALCLYQHKQTGRLTVRMEMPVYILCIVMSVVTAYMWMVAYLIKFK